VEKLPQYGGEKTRENRSIMWCVVYGTMASIYIDKGDRDRVISSYPANLTLTLNL
jgi:hypothetical protein